MVERQTRIQNAGRGVGRAGAGWPRAVHTAKHAFLRTQAARLREILNTNDDNDVHCCANWMTGANYKDAFVLYLRISIAKHQWYTCNKRNPSPRCTQWCKIWHFLSNCRLALSSKGSYRLNPVQSALSICCTHMRDAMEADSLIKSLLVCEIFMVKVDTFVLSRRHLAY